MKKISIPVLCIVFQGCSMMPFKDDSSKNSVLPDATVVSENTKNEVIEPTISTVETKQSVRALPRRPVVQYYDDEEEDNDSDSETTSYIVKRNDSLWGIAKAHNVSLRQLMNVNNITRATLLVEGMELIIPTNGGDTSKDIQKEPTMYVVKAGDSLSRIAKQFCTSVREIKDINGLKSDMIRVGQKLKISASCQNYQAKETSSTISDGETYTVKSGDSLSTIAKRFNTTIPSLKATNCLKSDMIRIGQKLKVSGKVSTEPSTPVLSKSITGDSYTVKAGDTLSKISANSGVKVSDLVKYNNIDDPKELRIGQTLSLIEKKSIEPVVETMEVKKEVEQEVKKDNDSEISDEDLEDFFEKEGEIPSVQLEDVK